jgi:ribonucleoside-diphosphate reductase alpha chain
MNGSSSIDFEGLEETIRFGVQFLDDIVEINSFPIKELREINLNTRNIGLGIMGWADMLAKLGIAYDSQEALDKANDVGSFIKNIVEDETTKLGKDRGNFPYFEGSGFEKVGLKYRRNNDTTTIAPTGQTSMYANCSSSIEPIIFPVINRNQGGLVQVEFHPALFKMLKDRNLDSQEVRDKLGKLGSVRKADFLPEDIKRIFPSSHDVSYEWHVNHQMTWQKYISSGVSKTINFHHDAKLADINNAFLLAYEGGCKGITVYRDGTRLNQPLSTVNKNKEEKLNLTGCIEIKSNRRDRVTYGTNRKIANGCGNLMVYVGNGENGKIQEITARLGKGGGCASAQTEAIARMASIAIQHGVDPEYIAKQLGGIRCHLTGLYRSKYTGKRPRIITSCADAMSVAISEHIANGTSKAKYTKSNDHVGACPECGGQLSFEEGCSKCYNCGFSRC